MAGFRVADWHRPEASRWDGQATSDVPYPDITDILDRKAQGRRDLARLSYGEKIKRVERMRDELAGMARAREVIGGTNVGAAARGRGWSPHRVSPASGRGAAKPFHPPVGPLAFARTGDVVSAFDTVPKGGLNHESFFLDGKVAGDPAELAFSATRLKNVRREYVDHEELVTGNFRIVAQLRAKYSSRFLQQTGQWMSRIGVDFVRGAT